MYRIGAIVARVASVGIRRVATILSMMVVAAALCITTPTNAAFAAGGVMCADELAFSGNVINGDRVSTEPSPAYLLCVQFDKNVSYAASGKDDSFVEENLAKVHLVGPDGSEVEGSYTGGAHDHSDRQLIYVYCDEWLQPAAEYKVIVDEGIMAANGEDKLANAKVYTFTTSDELPCGWTIHELVIVGAIAFALVAGVCVQVVRVVRRNR